MGKNYKGLRKRLNKFFFLKVYKLALETKMKYFMDFFKELPHGWTESNFYTNINYSLITWFDSLEKYISHKECFPFTQYVKPSKDYSNYSVNSTNYYGYYAQQLTRLLVLYGSKIPTYMLTDYAPYQGTYMVRGSSMTYEPITYNEKGNIRLAKNDIPSNYNFGITSASVTWSQRY